MTLTELTAMLLTTVLLLCSSFAYPTTAAEGASSDGDLLPVSNANRGRRQQCLPGMFVHWSRNLRTIRHLLAETSTYN